ncbi:MAG: DNA cytosine methyltransferase [Clostridium sp.]|uniref:DNA cytosine methyltransferase n=1 Tax=Clostridium sp. TaxID=1506 RepID=UPI003F2F6BF4
MKNLKIGSLFSGIGAYEEATIQLNINSDIKFYCELDRKKSKGYSLVHNVDEELDLIDVTNIDTAKLEDIDLLVYSPPCQSFSVAGKKKGLDDIRGTLFYDALKVIQAKKPKYCIMENVDNLPNKFSEEFNAMLNELDNAGYKNYWKIINAKDFIPQNRNRVYVVSIRKDIEQEFKFPIGQDQRDWTELIDFNSIRNLTARQQRMIDFVKGINNEDNIKIEGEPQFNKSVITLRQSGLRFQNNREYPTITAFYGKGGGNFTMMAKDGQVIGITPKNCFRLMGFRDYVCEKLTENKFSTSTQYIMAGDSVCVPVLKAIFEELLKDYIMK